MINILIFRLQLKIDFNDLYLQSSMSLFTEWSILSEFVQKEIKSKNPNFLTDAAYTPRKF